MNGELALHGGCSKISHKETKIEILSSLKMQKTTRQNYLFRTTALECRSTQGLSCEGREGWERSKKGENHKHDTTSAVLSLGYANFFFFWGGGGNWPVDERDFPPKGTDLAWERACGCSSTLPAPIAKQWQSTVSANCNLASLPQYQQVSVQCTTGFIRKIWPILPATTPSSRHA